MLEFIAGRYVYLAVLVLMAIGLYGALAKRNLLKKLIGMNIFSTAIFLFYVEGATKKGATVPIISDIIGNDPSKYINPLPHVLMLTGIVVSLALTGVALAFMIVIYRAYGSLDDKDIMKEMNK
jgi:multicomponent Na+:H+ antiporter subunit C